MLNQATLTADIIKQLSVNAVNATQPFAFMYGTVTSVDPIEIEIDQKLKLGEKQLIFSTLVQDFDVDMYMEHEVEETDLIHKHDASIVITSPHGDTGTITVQNSPDSDKHIHEYKGVKTFTLNLKLAKDEKVLLLRIQGGQKFLVLDRVRVLNDTEFSSEFEGEGSTGSSGGSSSGGSSSSGSGNNGNTSGGTDSGNGNNGGGDNEGSTDNVNPDSGGSVGDVISVTALMTALLALTPEQKQELGLTGVTIDDENVSSETTYSSEKIQNAISSNSFDIANLEETTELSNECCLPILQGEETKKVKVETLQSELNFTTTSDLATEINERKTADENLQSQMLRLIRKKITFTINEYYATLYPSDLGLEQFDENAIIQITVNGWEYIIYIQDISKWNVAVRFVRIDSSSGNSGVTLLYSGNITCQVKYVGK